MFVKRMLVVCLFASVAMAADSPIDRWAAAAGGRQKIAAIRVIYREGTLEWGGFQGSIKVWHTADGKFRKEEQVGPYSRVEICDGTNVSLQQNGQAPARLTGADLQRERASAYANANAMMFVFFPERRRGSVDVETDGTIVMKPEGGVDWRVTLDPQTSLPAMMTHQEGDRIVTVKFTGFETVDGIAFEKEIHRSNGNPKMDAVIRFNKTAINPAMEAGLFAVDGK